MLQVQDFVNVAALPKKKRKLLVLNTNPMNTDKIKKRIQVLCPDVMDTMLFEGGKGWQFGHKTSQGYYWKGPYPTKEKAHMAAIADGKFAEKDITIAVVLRAIENHLRTKFESQPNADLLSNFQEGLWTLTKDLLHKWNLKVDYDQQSEECKQFIGSLILGV